MGQANLPRSTRRASTTCHFFSTRRLRGVHGVLHYSRWKVRADGSADNAHVPGGARATASARFFPWLLAAAFALTILTASAGAADCLRPQDDFFLISSRSIGGRWSPDAWQRMECRRYVAVDLDGPRRWMSVPIEEFLAADASSQVTLVYVHGNRVRPGEDIAETLSVYRTLIQCAPHAPPIRLVAFSWPTEMLGGPLRDYRLKADLADPTALHLASVLARLPSDTHLALVGYSYGTRVIGGALHLLAGGRLCGYGLAAAANLPPARVLMISAAVHNDWLLPGRTHGMAMHLVDRLVLINNACDPAMRFYHVSSRRGRPYALGRWGVAGQNLLGEASARIMALDACREVGKRHALQYYLGATSLMRVASQQILPPESLPHHAADHRLPERTPGAASGTAGAGG